MEFVISGNSYSIRSLSDEIDYAFLELNTAFLGNSSISIDEFYVKSAIGIDVDSEKIRNANSSLKNTQAELRCENIIDSEISDATVILFWFTDSKIIEKMMVKFEKLKDGCKIITIWGPLPGCLPDRIDFPFIINQIPLKPTKDLQEQLLAVFGVKCVDFVTAWEFAERYTKAIESEESENDRFLTIMQSLVIWINAKNLGVACGEEIPEPIKAYMGILRNFFNIEVEHLLKK